MSAEEPARQFEFRVSLTPDEVAASFHDDPRIEWSATPPVSFAGRGKTFQAWVVDDRHIVIRHAVRDTKLGPSPWVHLEWSADPRGGTLVRGVFLRRAAESQERFLRIATPIMGVLAAVYVIAIDPGAILYAVACTIACIATYQASSNRPTARSMMNFGQGLWRLVGEKFVPHALGTGEDNPFRGRELPAKRE